MNKLIRVSTPYEYGTRSVVRHVLRIFDSAHFQCSILGLYIIVVKSINNGQFKYWFLATCETAFCIDQCERKDWLIAHSVPTGHFSETIEKKIKRKKITLVCCAFIWICFDQYYWFARKKKHFLSKLFNSIVFFQFGNKSFSFSTTTTVKKYVCGPYFSTFLSFISWFCDMCACSKYNFQNGVNYVIQQNNVE